MIREDSQCALSHGLAEIFTYSKINYEFHLICFILSILCQ